MKKLLWIVVFILPFCSGFTADGDLFLIPALVDPANLEQMGFQLYHQTENYRLGSLPEGVRPPAGSKVLDAYRTDGGDLYLAIRVSMQDKAKLSGNVRVLADLDGELIVQATQTELQALPNVRCEWIRIPLEARPLFHSPGVVRVTDDFSPFVQEMVDQVDEDLYIGYIQSLEDFVSRNTFAASTEDAAAWIMAQFASFGIDTYYHEFQVGGQTKRNVVGELTGMVHPDSLYLITAHYDATVGDQFSPEPVAPGANDNASGVAAVIESARILSRYRFDKTIHFVAFSGEEQGLVGSFAYTAYLELSPFEVAGSFNLDMVSYTGSVSPPWSYSVIVNNDPNSQAMGNKLVEAAATFLPSLSGNFNVSPGSSGSDHYPFWIHGWPATFSIQSYAYPYYHTVNDLTLYQNAEYGASVTIANLAALADMAVPGGGGTEVSGPVSGVWTYENHPYSVVDSVWIPEGQTLTIEPGVYVLFRGHHKFKVLENAALIAEGTSEDFINFSPFTPDDVWHSIRMYNTSSATSLAYCKIEGSVAEGSGEDDLGGALFLHDSSPSLEHCIITNCSADLGGGIYASNASQFSMENVTISGNSANDGGALYLIDSNPMITNSIFWDNSGGSISELSSYPVVTYSDIEGGWTGEGNLNEDPLFANPQGEDFHLQSHVGRYYFGIWIHDEDYSPCIDAGDPASSYSDEPEPNGDRINMGAYGNTARASFSQNDPYYAYGEVTGTWTLDNSPMHVIGDIYVPAGETLTIDPGVEVVFEGHYRFEIQVGAILSAAGTEEDSITFTAGDPEVGWRGIQLMNCSDNTLLENCYIANGRLLTGSTQIPEGGGIYSTGGAPAIRNCTIENCEADEGGGIYLDGSDAEITGCLIQGNDATVGGGIYVNMASPTLTGNQVCGNISTNGAGVAFWFAQGEMSNCIVADNEAIGQGGGLYLFNSGAEIYNCVVADNQGTTGGAIYHIGNTSSVVMNSIIWGNSGIQIAVGGGPDPEVTYCDVQGGWEGEGNIDEDPGFETGALSDYHLSVNSPCIDAGNPDAQYDDPEDPGNPGFAQWPAQGTVRNDMGTYGGSGAWNWVGIKESASTPLPESIALHQNYPNPFNPSTVISYQLPAVSSVNLAVYDLRGRKVVKLVNGQQAAGYHKVTFDARGLASGIYILQMKAGAFVGARKMVLVK